MILHHVSVGVSDVTRAGRFYDAVLASLGYTRYWEIMPYAIAYGEDGFDFWVQLPHDRKPASAGNGYHIAFNAKTKNAVHRFYEAALANGGSGDGAPGPRPDYGSDYYGCFVRDLDGNKIEAVLHPQAVASKPKAAVKAKKAKPPTKKAAAGKRSTKKAKAKAKTATKNASKKAAGKTKRKARKR